VADAELSIIVRAKDELSSALRQMGATVAGLARQVSADFAASGRGVDTLRTTVERSGTALTGLQAEASRAAEQVRTLGRADTTQLESSIRATRQEIDRLRSGTALELIPGGAALAAERLEQEVRGVEQALAAVRREGGAIDIEAKLAQAEQAFESFGRAANLNELEAEVARGRAELTRLREEADKAGVELTDLQRVRIDRLAADVAQGENALRRMRTASDQAEQGARALGRTFAGVGATIKSAILPILPILSLAGAAFAAQSSVTQALALEDALGRIGAEAKLSRAELAELRTGALATGRALGISEAKAAPALLSAVTDGARSASEGLDRYTNSARLAAAAGADVAKSTDLQTSVLNAYRESNLSAARAADITFQIVADGKVEVDELAGSLEPVLQLTGQMGIAFEELGAILAVASDTGGGFQQGMQAVRSVLTQLTEVSPEARKALQGIDFSAAAIRARGLVPVLVDIARKLDGNKEAIRAVFPDGRAFGSLLAILANDGENLSAALDKMRNSAGAVEDAIGRRMQDPAFRLTILFNQLRSSFAEAFGGAFLRGVDRAIEEMGGMERASRTVQDVARSIGEVFGAVFPAIGALIGSAAESMRAFVDGIGGADEIATRMRAVGDSIAAILGASLKIARIEIEALIRTVLLIPQSVAAAKDEWEATFGGETRRSIGQVTKEIEFLSAALASFKAPKIDLGEQRKFRNDLEQLLNASSGQATSAVVDVAFQFSEIEREDIERALASAQGRKVKLETEVVGDPQAFEKLAGKAGLIDEALAGVPAAFDELDRALDDLGRSVTTKTADLRANAAQPIVVPVAVRMEDAERDVAFFERQLAGLQKAADDALRSGASDSTLAVFLGSLGEQAKAVQSELNAARVALVSTRAEAQREIEVKITAKEEEIRRLEAGLADVRSEAELLGIDATRAGTLLGRAFSTDRIAAAREELARLRAQLTQASGETLVIEPRIGPGLLASFRDALRSLGRDVAARFEPGLMSRIGRLAGTQLRDGILDSMDDVDPFEGMLDSFRGGLAPAMERQSQLIEEQVERQRDATDSLRESLPLLRAAGLLTADRIELLDLETDRLEKSADLLRRRAALERSALNREALELGIEPVLDLDELRAQIDEARADFEREDLAIHLGVEVDDRAIAEAQREIANRMARLESRRTEREAIHFGVEIDGRALGQIQADIDEMREDAQDFIDGLRAKGARSEALVLGIELDQRSVDEIEREIARVRSDADAFARENPIQAGALASGVDGLSRAIGDVASGTRDAKEAFADFARSMVADVTAAIAKTLILKTLIAALGGPTGGAGAFLSTLLPGAAAGAVFPYAAGGFPAAPGDVRRRLSTDVERFALGGAPDLSRRLWTTVMPFAAGGLPDVVRHVRTAYGDEPGMATRYALGGTPAIRSASAGYALPIRGAYAAGGLPSAPEPFGISEGFARAYALGGSPYLDRIVRAPTYERAERMAGMAIVPLSGGGVATTDGRKLGLERKGSELVVRHALGGVPLSAELRAFARGGRPEPATLALFGEAGDESVMRTYRSRDGRVGLKAASGEVLPLTRVAGGRLGVEAFALGGYHNEARESGTNGTYRFAFGGLPAGALRSVAALQPFALGAADGHAEAGFGASPPRSATAVRAFWAGGLPALSDMRVPVEPYWRGGLPAYAPRIERYAVGGFPSAAPTSAGGSTVVNVHVAVAQAPMAASTGAAEPREQFEARMQSAFARSSELQELVAAIVNREQERRPSTRAALRGDRA
jgi:TP901 family phage tail tape measure protein